MYPPDFNKKGLCWTFRRVTKARSKAKSLGVGSWIRRYVNVSEFLHRRKPKRFPGFVNTTLETALYQMVLHRALEPAIVTGQRLPGDLYRSGGSFPRGAQGAAAAGFVKRDSEVFHR